MNPEQERELTRLRLDLGRLLLRREHLLAIFHSASTSPGSRRDSGGALDCLRLEIEEIGRKTAEIDQV